MSYALDPYTRVERALFVALEQVPTITSAVKVGNRLRPDALDPKAKGATLDADRPELILECVGTEPDVNNTSNASTERRRYRVHLVTGRLNAQYADIGVNVLEKAIKDAIWRLKDRLGPTCPFVSMVRTVGVQRGIEKDESGKTREGWTAVTDILVTCNFTNASEVFV